MWGWLSELLEIKHTFRERKLETKVCDSCEILKLQLSIMNQNNKELMNRILEKPEPESKPDVESFVPINKHEVPFRVRREILEREDRAKAKSLKLAAKPDSSQIEELEKELGIIEVEK